MEPYEGAPGEDTFLALRQPVPSQYYRIAEDWLITQRSRKRVYRPSSDIPLEHIRHLPSKFLVACIKVHSYTRCDSSFLLKPDKISLVSDISTAPSITANNLLEGMQIFTANLT